MHMICTKRSCQHFKIIFHRLCSENEDKHVYVNHIILQRSQSVIIRQDAIVINSMEWAVEIFSEIGGQQKQIPIKKLIVAFVDGNTHAVDKLANDFLDLILNSCHSSVVVLELSGLGLKFFQRIQQNPFNSVFPNLQDMALTKTVINHDVLNIFRCEHKYYTFISNYCYYQLFI